MNPPIHRLLCTHSAPARNHLQADIDAKLEDFARGAALKAARQLLPPGELSAATVEGEIEVPAHFECWLSLGTGEHEPLYDPPGGVSQPPPAPPPAHPSRTLSRSHSSSLSCPPIPTPTTPPPHKPHG